MNFKLMPNGIIFRKDDQAFIPPDTENYDYIKYLKWVDEGNKPEPMDPPSTRQAPNTIDKLASMGITVDELKNVLGIKK